MLLASVCLSLFVYKELENIIKESRLEWSGVSCWKWGGVRIKWNCWLESLVLVGAVKRGEVEAAAGRGKGKREGRK